MRRGKAQQFCRILREIILARRTKQECVRTSFFLRCQRDDTQLKRSSCPRLEIAPPLLSHYRITSLSTAALRSNVNLRKTNATRLKNNSHRFRLISDRRRHHPVCLEILKYSIALGLVSKPASNWSRPNSSLSREGGKGGEGT